MNLEVLLSHAEFYCVPFEFLSWKSWGICAASLAGQTWSSLYI